MTEVIECYEEVAAGANCAVHLWHHTRKGNGEGATVESARGAQAFVDAYRSVRILERMTKKERNDLLVAVPDIGEAGWYFREFNGKRNFAPPADESSWYRYVSIELDNAPDSWPAATRSASRPRGNTRSWTSRQPRARSARRPPWRRSRRRTWRASSRSRRNLGSASR